MNPGNRLNECTFIGWSTVTHMWQDGRISDQERALLSKCFKDCELIYKEAYGRKTLWARLKGFCKAMKWHGGHL